MRGSLTKDMIITKTDAVIGPMMKKAVTNKYDKYLDKKSD